MKNKVAIITGATGALGCEVVRAFLNTGATVVTTYRRSEKLRELQEHIGRTDFHAIETDVLVTAQVKAMADEVLQQFDRIDILVNCVGGFLGGVLIADSTKEQWQQMFDLNFKSVFLCSRAADYITGQVIASDGGYTTTANWPFAP